MKWPRIVYVRASALSVSSNRFQNGCKIVDGRSPSLLDFG